MNNSKPQVLLIDDDQVYLFAATKTIEATGLAGNVEVCTNGLDALEYLKNLIKSSGKLPDVIFIDMELIKASFILNEKKNQNTKY